VKRKTNGENDIQEGDGKGSPTDRVQEFIDIGRKEIIVFEKRENPDVGNNTHDQEELPFPSLRIFDQDTGDIIDDNRKNEDQDIDGNKINIEDATGNQQVSPSPGMGKQEIDQRDQGEKNQKLKGIKQHSQGLS
jgi:hypothetical protein